ncbi:MAG: BatD family protein [Chitinophagaceae bacterium]
MTKNIQHFTGRVLIHIRKSAVCFAGFFLLPVLTIFSQTFNTTASPGKIGKNQLTVVTYEIGGAGSVQNFQAPQFKDWEVASGPNQSSYTSSVNGTVTRRTAISYYLQPKRTGRLVVEGARAQVDGKQLNSNSTIVEVLAKNVDEQAPQQNKSDPLSSLFDDPLFGQDAPAQEPENVYDDAAYIKAGEDLNRKINQVLLLKVTTSKNSCYEGEPIMATYKLYARVDVEVGFNKRPSFSGFSAFDMEEPSQSYVYETLNGKKFKVYTIRKVQLYPLQSGTLTLDPVELECKMRFIKYEAAASPNFDPYNSSNYLNTQYALKSPALNIAVLPLPTEGRPADFKGAVGNFSINALTNSTETGKDDATTLQVSVRGSGNFSLVQAPVVQWPKGVEAYDPSQRDNLIKSVMPVAGDKTFDYVFLSHAPGTLTIPAVKFSYFDITAKAYKTIETKPVTIQVAAESKRPKQDTDEAGANWPLIFVAIAKYVLPLLAAGLVLYVLFSFFIRRKRKQQHSEMRAMEDAWERVLNDTKQQATINQQNKVVIGEIPAVDGDEKYMPAFSQAPLNETATSTEVMEERLHEPSNLLQSEAALWMPDHRVFYQALKNDMLQAMVMATGQASANKTALLLTLQQRGADVTALRQLNSIMDECDAAIYSPVHYDADRQKTLDEVRFLLKALK